MNYKYKNVQAAAFWNLAIPHILEQLHIKCPDFNETDKQNLVSHIKEIMAQNNNLNAYFVTYKILLLLNCSDIAHFCIAKKTKEFLQEQEKIWITL